MYNLSLRCAFPGFARRSSMIFGLGLWAFALCAGPAAHAGDAGVATADALAMGGAVTADPHASGALLPSPATLALEPRYDLYFGAPLGGTDALSVWVS